MRFYFFNSPVSSLLRKVGGRRERFLGKDRYHFIKSRKSGEAMGSETANWFLWCLNFDSCS